MRILLLSQLARGHAVAEALKRSAQPFDLFHISTFAHPFIRALSKEQHVVESLADLDEVLPIAGGIQPDLTYIESEEAIAAGIADSLQARQFDCVAPVKQLGQIESSKSFMRALLAEHNIDASPRHRVFIDTDPQPMRSYIQNELLGKYVVKFDGLKGGKGVRVAGDQLKNFDEGIAYAQLCLQEHGRVLIEEQLEGEEFSLSAFVCGDRIVPMPPTQDHHRARDGDTGPNTGSMGTINYEDHALPYVAAQDLDQARLILQQIASALLNTSHQPYRGILCGEFMAVREGVKLLECNARFGDDALSLLPILTTDFLAICQAITQGTLTPDLVQFAPMASVCKYIVPKSYPEGKEEIGEPVLFPGTLPPQTFVYYGEVTKEPDGTLLMGASRTAGVIGTGANVQEAEIAVELLCQRVQGAVRFRRDIGTPALTEKWVQHMRNVRRS